MFVHRSGGGGGRGGGNGGQGLNGGVLKGCRGGGRGSGGGGGGVGGGGEGLGGGDSVGGGDGPYTYTSARLRVRLEPGRVIVTKRPVPTHDTVTVIAVLDCSAQTEFGDAPPVFWVSPIQTVKAFSRVWQQSARLSSLTVATDCDEPRSISSHGSVWSSREWQKVLRLLSIQFEAGFDPYTLIRLAPARLSATCPLANCSVSSTIVAAEDGAGNARTASIIMVEAAPRRMAPLVGPWSVLGRSGQLFVAVNQRGFQKKSSRFVSQLVARLQGCRRLQHHSELINESTVTEKSR